MDWWTRAQVDCRWTGTGRWMSMQALGPTRWAMLVARKQQRWCYGSWIQSQSIEGKMGKVMVVTIDEVWLLVDQKMAKKRRNCPQVQRRCQRWSQPQRYPWVVSKYQPWGDEPIYVVGLTGGLANAKKRHERLWWRWKPVIKMSLLVPELGLVDS